MNAPEFWRDHERLPSAVKSNLTAEQWEEAQARVVLPGATIPDSAIYLNLKNGSTGAPVTFMTYI